MTNYEGGPAYAAELPLRSETDEAVIGTVEILDHEAGILGGQTNRALRGYNKLAKGQQMRGNVTEEHADGTIDISISRPRQRSEWVRELLGEDLQATVKEIASYFGYISSTDGQVKLFRTLKVLGVNRDQSIIRKGRLLCLKPSEEQSAAETDATILFVLERDTVASHH